MVAAPNPTGSRAIDDRAAAEQEKLPPLRAARVQVLNNEVHRRGRLVLDFDTFAEFQYRCWERGEVLTAIDDAVDLGLARLETGGARFVLYPVEEPTE